MQGRVPPFLDVTTVNLPFRYCLLCHSLQPDWNSQSVSPQFSSNYRSEPMTTLQRFQQAERSSDQSERQPNQQRMQERQADQQRMQERQPRMNQQRMQFCQPRFNQPKKPIPQFLMQNMHNPNTDTQNPLPRQNPRQTSTNERLKRSKFPIRIVNMALSLEQQKKQESSTLMNKKQTNFEAIHGFSSFSNRIHDRANNFSSPKEIDQLNQRKEASTPKFKADKS